MRGTSRLLAVGDRSDDDLHRRRRSGAGRQEGEAEGGHEPEAGAQAGRAQGQGEGAERGQAQAQGAVVDLRSAAAAQADQAGQGTRAGQERDRPPAAHVQGPPGDRELRGAQDRGQRQGGFQGQGQAQARHGRVQAAEDRPQPGGELRLHRRSRGVALHAAVPRRLLHGQGQLHEDRAAGQLHRRRDAAERRRHPDRRRSVQPQRRLQPRSGDHAQGPRARHAGRPRQHQPDPAQRPEPQRVPGLEGADRRHRRRDREAGADLGRDRLQREHPGGDGGADPRRDPVRVGPALHRRHAQAQGRERQQARRARGLPLLPRRPAVEEAADQRPAQALRQDLPRPAPGGHQAVQPVSRLGLHRRQRREHRRAAPAHPQ